MGIINSNFNVNLNRPIDSKYMNGSTPWLSTTEANDGIPAPYRYIGLTVNINNVEYWYKDGTADVNLVLKSTSGTVTGAANGLSLIGTTIKLGGTLSGDTIITDNRVVKKGIEYGGDYSIYFTPESLVTKRYADSLAAGLHTVAAAVVATTGNLTYPFTGNQSIDGITTFDYMRILVKDQTNKVQNGIWIASASTWTRAEDFDTSGETLQGSLIPVITGSTQKNTLWVLVTTNPNPGVSNMEFTLFTSPVYIAGTGIDIAGSTISLDANTIFVTDNAITGATNGLGITGRNVYLGGTISNTTLIAPTGGDGLLVCSIKDSCSGNTIMCNGTLSASFVNTLVCSNIVNNGDVVLKSQTVDTLCSNQMCFKPDGVYLTVAGYPANTGFQYVADYCNIFNACNRAIPDTGWVKRYVSGNTLSGTAYHIPVFNSSGSGITDSSLTFISNVLCNSNDLTIQTNAGKLINVISDTGVNIDGGGNTRLCNLPAKTSETNIVYYDTTTGMLAYGTGGTGSGGGGGTGGMSIFTITGTGAATGFTVTHGTGTYVDVTVIDNDPLSDYQTIYPSITRPTANDVCIEFKTAPDVGHEYKVLVSYSGNSGVSAAITGAANGLTKVGTYVRLGGTLTGTTTIIDSRGTKVGIEYGGDYSSDFTNNSLISKLYADTINQKVTKTIYQPSHGFAVKDVIGWSVSGGYDKAIANGAYNGEILGIVSKYIDANYFELTQSGYVDGLSGLIPNKTYFLSDTVNGLMTTGETTVVGHINKAVLIANTTSSGWVLPYAGYVVSVGSEGGGTNTVRISQTSHGFTIGDVVGISGSTYNKAIANGNYNGEVIGVITRIISPNVFDITQAGYVNGITGVTPTLVANTTYYLSDVNYGKLITSKPTTLGHVVRAVFATDSGNTSGWVLPYPGVLLTTGSTSGITVTAGLGLTAVGDVFNVNIATGTTSPSNQIPVKISPFGTNVLYIDSTDISGGTTTILLQSGATKVNNISGSTWVIYSPTGGTGSGTITGGTNLGTGYKIYTGTSGQNLQFNNLIGSGNTSLSQIGNDIIIFSSGGTGGGTWGSITGTLPNQTDLWDEIEYSLTADTKSAVNLGGISINYVLTGKTMSCIIKDLLVPELFPTSVGSLSTSVGGAGGTYEVGCSLSLTITPTYVAGTITPPYQTTAPYTRGGAANSYQYKGCCLPDTGRIVNTSCSVNPYIVSGGTNIWCVRTWYDQGATIKGSKGTVSTCPAHLPNPLPSGCTAYGTTSLTGIYPYFYGKLTSGGRPAVTNILVTGGTKVVSTVGSSISIPFSNVAEWTWFAMPSNCATRTKWLSGAAPNCGDIAVLPTDKYPDECLISITSGEGCWSSINYKVYMSGAASTDALPIQFNTI
jgi:hypothetical protein